MNATLLERNVCVPEFLPRSILTVDVEHLEDFVAFAQVRGEATGEEGTELVEQLRSSLMPGTRFVVLDLAGLTLLGPAALAALAEFSRDFARTGGEVWLTGLRPAVWLDIHVARVERLFTIRSSRAQALSA
jgi:anti-anti-sigma factor